MSDTPKSIVRRPLEANASCDALASDINCLWGVVERMRRETSSWPGLSSKIEENIHTMSRMAARVDELVRKTRDQSARLKILERHDLEANPVMFKDEVARQDLRITAQDEQIQKLANAMAGLINRGQDEGTTVHLLRQNITSLMADVRALRAELDLKANITFRKGPQAGGVTRQEAYGAVAAAPLPDITDAVKAAGQRAQDIDPFFYRPFGSPASNYGVAPIQRMDPVEAAKLRAQEDIEIEKARKACEEADIAKELQEHRGRERTAIDIKSCARCGGEHFKLEFRKLRNPILVGPDNYSHYAACPTNGEPLLLSILEKPEPARNVSVADGSEKAVFIEQALSKLVVELPKMPPDTLGRTTMDDYLGQHYSALLSEAVQTVCNFAANRGKADHAAVLRKLWADFQGISFGHVDDKLKVCKLIINTLREMTLMGRESWKDAVPAHNKTDLDQPAFFGQIGAPLLPITEDPFWRALLMLQDIIAGLRKPDDEDDDMPRFKDYMVNCLLPEPVSAACKLAEQRGKKAWAATFAGLLERLRSCPPVKAVMIATLEVMVNGLLDAMQMHPAKPVYPFPPNDPGVQTIKDFHAARRDLGLVLMELEATQVRMKAYAEGGGDQRNLHASGLAQHVEPLCMAITDAIATVKGACEVAEVFVRLPGSDAFDVCANKQAL